MKVLILVLVVVLVLSFAFSSASAYSAVIPSLFHGERSTDVAGPSCVTFQSNFGPDEIRNGDYSGGADFCVLTSERFDTSSIPQNAVISSIQMNGTKVNFGSGGVNCDIQIYKTDPSTDLAATVFATVKNAPSGSYVTNTSFCKAGLSKVNLGSTAITILKNSTSPFFAVGLLPHPFGNNNGGGVLGATFTKIQLVVNYTLPVPSSVSNLSCIPSQALGITCNWINATSSNGKVLGSYITRNSTTQPLFSNNLVTYYKMDALDGIATMQDYSNNKNNATMTGPFVNTTGMIGNAYQSTHAQFLTSSTITLPSGSSDRTISFWFKTSSNATQQGNIFGMGTNSSNSGFGLYLNKTKLVYEIGSTNVTTTTNLQTSKWYHVLMSLSNSGTQLDLYLNGTEDNSFPSTVTSRSTTLTGMLIGSGKYFGHGLPNNPILPTGNLIDDFRIYKTILPNSQIQKLYNYRLISSLSNLDSYLLLDGRNYNYCVYPLNQYGQNTSNTCFTNFAGNYAVPPNQLNGKFYKNNTNNFNTQISWSKPNQFLNDMFISTGYTLQKWTGSSWSTVLSNTTRTTYHDTSLAQIMGQKYRVFSNSHLGISPGYIFENQNATGLKSFFQFDNNTLDSRGSNTVSIKGNESYALGYDNLGYALSLNGTSYGKATATGIPNGTSDRTLSLWIKPASFSSNSNGYVSTGSNSANGQFGIIDANGKIDCGGAGNNVNTTTTLTINKWNLITCVLSNSGTTRSIYINGTLDTSSSTTAINSAATSLYVGTRSDNTNRNVTGLIDNLRIYSSALNSTQVKELYNETLTSVYSNNMNLITATHTLSNLTVGDITRETSHFTLNSGFPSPTLVNFRLFNFSTVVNTTTLNQVISSGSSLNNLYSNYINVSSVHNFKGVALVSNGTTTGTFNSSVYPVTKQYTPSYKPSIQGNILVNYTLTRPSPSTNVTLRANQVPILFDMRCQIQIASDAAAGKNNGWYNYSNVGYFFQSVLVHNYDNVYGSCYSPTNLKLFTFVSYGNSSLFPAINFMNTSYGAFVGVPVGVVFIVMAAALGNKRTAPMWVIVILAMAGIMSTVGFFTLNPGIWALALTAGLLALFVGRKII